MIEEETTPSVKLQYSYDPFNRLTGVHLPDGSSITYHYEGYHLRTVNRHHPDGQLAYSCCCPSYDKRGQLLKSVTPAGTTNFTYDLLGRPIQIDASQWRSHLKQFDPAGNLLQMSQIDPDGEQQGHFSYDRYDHLKTEDIGVYNAFDYDSIGNCLWKNGQEQTVNGLNQLCHDGQASYHYDLNGNLIAQSAPNVTYRYDALNRLIAIDKAGEQITLLYDSFDRCVQVNDSTGQKQLLYQGEKEIGSIQSGRIKELRLAHPNAFQEHVFALEIDRQTFFPIQDYRYNISALYRQDGSIAQWYRYSAFGLQSTNGIENLSNPWRFANRREIAGLSLFTHRLYHPGIRRWLTTDPLGFEDGFNLYAYVHNNPFRYTDPDGLNSIALEICRGTIGTAGIVFSQCFPIIGWGIAAILVGYVIYEGLNELSHHINKNDNEAFEEEEKEKKEKLVFPENPDDLLPDLSRGPKGEIRPAENIRIRPEKHSLNDGDEYNPRHHEQHYHVESRRNPGGKWNENENIEIEKPNGYYPGMGTGFLPGETFPGA